MDSLEAIQLPISRTFWNSHDPSLDPFDENLVPTNCPLEACSSTFLFPSTSSTCDESDDIQAIFKLRPSQQTNILFDDNNPVEGGAESSLATAESYCTNADPGGMNPSSQFSWLSASPHYHPLGVGAANSQRQVHSGGGLVPDLFGPLNSNALESGHGSEDQAFLKVPLMRQPSFRQLGGKQLNTKASWQSSGNVFQANMSFDQGRRISRKDQPLGSPCSVISGFTKVLQGVEPVCNDYNMETSFGPSTSAVHDHEGKYVNSQESPLTAREGASTQSMSGTHEQAVAIMNKVATKRTRSKAPKHSNEVESQRMTHIAVERNRRKQMNEHLAALRALMPGSYVQKGDQASIVGGAIEFVKELEHLLHCLQSQKRRRSYSELTNPGTPTSRLAMPNPDQQLGQIHPPFSFHNPQRLVDQNPFRIGASTENQLGNTRHPQITTTGSIYPTQVQSVLAASPASSSTIGASMNETVGEAKSDMASVEVKMVGSDQAMVKIMALRRSGQLLRTVVALESLALTVMHTNITTVHHTVLYSFQVQVGPLCRMNQDEIAAAVHQTFSSLHSLQF